MKKIIYTTVIILFVTVIGFVVYKYKANVQKEKTVLFELKKRNGSLANSDEWHLVQKKADEFKKALSTDPTDTKALIGMASLFIQEARITGDYMYYDKAAMNYTNRVLSIDSSNFEAMCFKSMLYLSQHHFADGLNWAQKAQQKNPYSAFIYGMLVDGNVEMGNYDAAVNSADSMISMRPDIRSYSRVSYLREIYDDYKGAIDAMKMAVDAGAPGDESTEWARVQLGHLYEQAGDIANAEMNYTIAINNRPSYAYAMAGMARIAAAKKDFTKAVDLYKQASALVNDYSIKEELVELYIQQNEKEKAAVLNKEIIDRLSSDAASANNNDAIGHYADRELAYAYLNDNNIDKALEHALLEYNRRPGNIDVNEMLAWVYYKKGDYSKATEYMKVAMKTNSKNPVRLCRAGLIYAKANDKLMAKNYISEALKNNPNINETLKSESEVVLKSL
ncbi:MAG: tetratricopeptide repeat protein [Sphingobacteriales bacterium]|nr:MAG: tetratricopeptide repeat protein [Sphingobacteriales bacterium]